MSKVIFPLFSLFLAVACSTSVPADGTPLTGGNFLDYIKELLIESAQKAKNAGADISADLGFQFNSESRGRVGEFITDLDMPAYLNYVVSTQPLKGVPSFDSQGVLGSRASGENEEFGDTTGSSVNFTEYGAAANGVALGDEIKHRVFLMNPMDFICNPKATNAPHWYVRHGARDRDTSFPVPVVFATKLENAGLDVDFLLAWNRPHSGDYALDEVFDWIRQITSR